MADLSILAGSTSQSINVDLYILASGAAQTGLVFNSTSLTANYSFTGANATSTSITLVTLAAVTTAYSSGGFKELDATNMPGLYRLDLPNAALATSKGREVVITINGFSGMATRHIKIELTAVDNQSIAFGLTLAKTTNITGFNDIAASAVVSSGAITTSSGAVSTVTNLTNAPTAGDFTATMKTSIGTAVAGSAVASVTGNVGGNVTGSVGSVIGAVGSVTGAVGSVTGNVGGNVTGSIGSLGTTAKTDVSTAVLTTAMTESYPTKGSTFTLSQGLYNLVQELGERAITSTTVTILKRDQATTAKTYTLNSSSNPTASTEAT